MTPIAMRPSDSRRRHTAPLALAMAWAQLCLAQFPPSASQLAPAAPAAAWPAGAKEFQAGVAIDWNAPAVFVRARIALREGPLEFVACFAGKEHESLARLEASAASIYMAMGLIGLSAGAPPRWDEKLGEFQPPTGDLVDASFVVGAVETPVWEWMIDGEFARTPLPRPWVFAGSIKLEQGGLAADRSGAGIAIVDFGDSLLSLPRSRPSRNTELWALANPGRVPPRDTPILVRLAPARPRQHRFSLDFRGDLRVDDQIIARDDFFELLQLQRRLSTTPVNIDTSAALQADIRRVLEESGALP